MADKKGKRTPCLASWLRYHLALRERMSDFEIGTEEVRVLIDFWEEYKNSKEGNNDT